MKPLLGFSIRLAIAFMMFLAIWASCTFPADGERSTASLICRVLSWPVRLVTTSASAVGLRSDPLSVGWCDFCSTPERLFRMLITIVPTYLVLLYVPLAVLRIVNRIQRHRRATTKHEAARTRAQ